MSETTDSRFVGTALTALRFALTVLSIQPVPLLADAIGWQCAFLMLGAHTTHRTSTPRKKDP